MIVGVGEDGYAALPNLAAVVNPTRELTAAVNDDLVPSLCDLLDSFAVAEPTDVCPVGGDWVELELAGVRHPALVLEDQRDAVLAQQVGEPSVEPVLVPNLHGELAVLGEFAEERFQADKKLCTAGEHAAVEIRELKHHWPELLAKQVHRFHELLQLVIAVHEHLFVRNDLRHFGGKDEPLGRLRVPAMHRGQRRDAVERAVHLDGIEMLGVVAQIIGRLEAIGIERARPSGSGESGGAEVHSWRHGPCDSTPSLRQTCVPRCHLRLARFVLSYHEHIDVLVVYYRGMERTALWLKEDQLKKLRALSEKTGAPVAELIRRAIDKYLQERAKELK